MPFKKKALSLWMETLFLWAGISGANRGYDCRSGGDGSGQASGSSTAARRFIRGITSGISTIIMSRKIQAAPPQRATLVKSPVKVVTSQKASATRNDAPV